MVDKLLAEYGFLWELNPYRITDKNGAVIQAGPHFDVRPQTLRRCAKAAQTGAKNKFKTS